MPRSLRHFLPGHIWHITHRCHDREFYFEQAAYRKLWIDWLKEAKDRYNVSTLNFTVTSNHIHLLLISPNDMEGIPRSIQLVAGRTAQAFNKKQCRSGAFWEKRYSATAIESGEHLARCMLYIDTNMVRAGVVKHPKDWEHSGYHEVIKPNMKNKLLDRKKLADRLEVDVEDLPKQYSAWLKEALRKGNLSRDEIWTTKIAAGSETFIEKIKRRLEKIKKQGPKLLSGPDHALNEDYSSYGEWDNNLEWEIESNKGNDISQL